jgi:hypothetical protein
MHDHSVEGDFRECQFGTNCFLFLSFNVIQSIPRVKYIDYVLLLLGFFPFFIHLRNKCVFPFIKLQVEHNN